MLDKPLCYFFGKFTKFNIKTRILETEKGTMILLPLDKIEKTGFLKDRTKKWLNSLV
jgi:hypothetical protein